MDSHDNLLAAGREIRRHRQAAGLSQEQLAERAGLHRNYIGLMERGQRNAALTTLLSIAAALDMSLSELFVALPKSNNSGDGRRKAEG